MPNTPNRGYAYPSGGDEATVPADLQEPLEWIDADVQALVDETAGKVTGLGANSLWVGTYTEYDEISVPDPNTVYIIRGGERSNPGKRWGLGVPAFTAPEEGTAAAIKPDLPLLDLEDWGYLVITATLNARSTPIGWTIPDGWTRLADHIDVDDDKPSYGVRPIGVFAAPAGTATGGFYISGAGQARTIAAAFPIRLQPTSEGIVLGDWAYLDETFTVPGMQYPNPAVPITIAVSSRGSLAGTIVPSVPGADYNEPTPTTIVSGMGLTVLHLFIGDSPVSYAGEAAYTVSDSLDQYSTAYRIGIGSL